MGDATRSGGEPIAPVFPDVAPHLRYEDVMRVWFVEPLGVVTQLCRPIQADMNMARFLTDEMDPALRRLAANDTDKFGFVHDWRNLHGYDTHTRKHLTEWGIGLRRQIRALVVVLSPQTPALARMGVTVAFGALRVAGIEASLADDIEAVVSGHGLHPRAADSLAS